ncbi:Swarming motility protein SwrAA [Bacillus lacus]|uniref:Swarming motility protein SwrAA n=1 Tax=Metabacillus lacus TaxID=1983721 RepID=A0A7X2LZQ8_9BACI|nr:swarming motility protein SwrAA [Metabacillus lacus]MRX72217.1 Swarming motility protein SwrAA [Metabacillus lacus]
MKRSSAIREQRYKELIEQFKVRIPESKLSHAKVSKLMQIFCMYLVNYTEINHLDEIKDSHIQDYFQYVMDSYRRLSLSLTDIKNSMKLIEEALHISIDSSMLDFSLSNTNLWNKLK